MNRSVVKTCNLTSTVYTTYSTVQNGVHCIGPTRNKRWWGGGEGGGEGRGGHSETFPIDFAFLSAGEGKLIFSYSPTGCLFF